VTPHVHRDTPDDRSENESTRHHVLLRPPRLRGLRNEPLDVRAPMELVAAGLELDHQRLTALVPVLDRPEGVAGHAIQGRCPFHHAPPRVSRGWVTGELGAVAWVLAHSGHISSSVS